MSMANAHVFFLLDRTVPICYALKVLFRTVILGTISGEGSALNISRLLQFVRQFQKYFDRQFDRILEEQNLTIREIHVLLFLANNPACDTARDITQLRGIPKSQVSQAVDLLAASGLLLRKPDPADRRMVHLSITPLGMPLARECQAIQERCLRQLLDLLPPEEQRQFQSCLNTLLENSTRLFEENRL